MIITDGTRTIEITINRAPIADTAQVEDITEDVFCDLAKNEDGIYEAEDVDYSIQTAKDFCKGTGEYDFDHSQGPLFYIGLDIEENGVLIEEAPVLIREWYRH